MNIIWTLKALESYFNVSDYLQEEWNSKVVREFAEEVEKVINGIQENPHMFEASKKQKNIRKGFVTKHNLLYYRIKPRKEEIELLLFWDTRQDLKKLKFK